MPSLDALIFDLDGTLVDSAADLHMALNAILEAHGRRTLTLDETKKMTGDGLHTLLDRAFMTTGGILPSNDSPQLMKDFLNLYQSQTATKDMLYPLVLETLKFFKDNKIKLGLCTNKLYQPTLKLLKNLEIDSWFDFIAGVDTFSVCKPHPGHVLGVVEALHSMPGNCVMIGDSLNDIRASRAAQVRSIAVSHGYGDAAVLGADSIISGFSELPNALGRLGFDFIGSHKSPGG